MTSNLVATEESPLLLEHCENGENSCSDPVFPIQILGELIGVRHLAIAGSGRRRKAKAAAAAAAAGPAVEPYCLVRWGTKTLHRTSALSKDGIWTISKRPLFLVSVTANDLRNNKALVLALWSKSSSTGTAAFVGRVQIKSVDLIDLCHEQRVELDLVDQLGRSVVQVLPASSSNLSNGDNNSAASSSSAATVDDDPEDAQEEEQPDSPKLALRFRLASRADVKFVEAWNRATEGAATSISRTVLNGTGVVAAEHRPHAVLVTEKEDWEVAGATFGSAVTSSLRGSSSPRRRNQLVRIKPCPDPDATATTTAKGLVGRDQLKAITREPSRQWVEVGSGTLGHLYLEILSCSQLPNVDYGETMGNQTDAFVCAVYGDAMAQTCIIDDELSPHWPPWTQRAFCFSVMHPSQVLYLGVFGYKRGIFNHAPIGRVEVNPVNFQRDTEYNLEFDLFAACHVSNRRSAGKIRIRLRTEIFNERAALLAALRPCPKIYLSSKRKKSLYVARFTASGEYDNPEAFSLKVLLAYIDEITKGFLQRILYSVGDGVQSLVFWKDQVEVAGVWLPLHSLVVFFAAVVVVEHPQFIPGFVFLGAAYFMLVNMTVRIQSPSPWHRCFSFWHYLSILVLGKSSPKIQKISPGEGWKEQNAIQEAWKERAEENERFFHKKEAMEKEIEASKISVQTQSRAAIVSLELLVILGKIQGIVGTFIRLCRAIDCIVTWEESSLAFWITTILLLIGVLFLFVPWVFLLKWTSRIAVVLFLGPQNKILALLLARKESDESRLRQMYKERRFRARCRQEENSKLKSFRHVVFGKYGSVVPDIKWSPHLDRPCPESEASAIKEPTVDTDEGPCIPGQKLHGLMVPRPYDQWLVNSNESKATKERVVKAIEKLNQIPFEAQDNLFSPPSDEMKHVEEGFEVADLYDIEADLEAPFQQAASREESLKGDWGVEAVDINEQESMFLRKTFEDQPSPGSVDEGDDMLSIASSDADDSTLLERPLPTIFSDQVRGNGSERLQLMQAQPGKSKRELGVEIQSEFLDEEDGNDEGDDNGEENDERNDDNTDTNGAHSNHEALFSSNDNGTIDADLNGIADDGVEPISNVRTMEAEAGASRRELGVEIVAFEEFQTQ